ncbi:MAG: hypothetical protein JWN99_2862 [Ilumatobacteraceae bacterium]|nr:hypothetical protein [Ilumatobacteraceae bacterium]
MTGDPQDQAESIDEDQIGGAENAVTSDEAEAEFPPDRAQGILFADADITDESVEDRALQEEPEVWERADPAEVDSDLAADERLEQIIDLSDQS